MADANVHRSQVILRMPVDYVDATLILHDGERDEVIFLMPSGEDVTSVLEPGEPFVPVMRNAKICIVARDAIAALGVPLREPSAFEAEMPSEQQRVAIKLGSGLLLDGELRWPVVSGKQRTADHLNTDARYIELRTADKSLFIAKAHVAYVQEM
jgi:hypothetical protein